MLLRGWRSFTGITTTVTTAKTPGISILGVTTTTTTTLPTRRRRATVAAFCTAPSPHNREGMENKEKNDENGHDNDDHHHHRKKKDTMSHSFGVGYGTRSDEEGFGGIYGGGYASEDPEHHANHPEYDKSQGSEVKEKEKARNLSDDSAATGHAHDQRAAAAEKS